MEQQLPNSPVSPTHITHHLNAHVRLSYASESPITSANKRAQLIHWLIYPLCYQLMWFWIKVSGSKLLRSSRTFRWLHGEWKLLQLSLTCTMSIPVRGDHSYTTWRVRRSKLSSMKGASSCQKTAHCSPLSSHLSILYCNARSIISKFDELCALIEVHSPRIVCIVETWLSYEVSDSEFTLPGSALIETTMVVGCLSMFIPTLQPMCISYLVHIL